jgi:hypothetical protein
MIPRGRIAKGIVLLGLALFISACASPPGTEKALGLAPKETARGLVPQDYLCQGSGPQEAADPRLSREIQGFLEENGMLGGIPPSLASDLPLVLNGPVKSYLRSFSQSQKGTFETYLSRSGRYLPMMRRIFQEYGLPQDLVYLALVESGFSPQARSPAEAVGCWQFIAGTARRYGLRVNSWVDERRDPEKSTRAAARYLKDLFNQFGCWFLAAAGYNAGEHRVEGTVHRHDTRDFWTMAQKKLLPQETCNYVPQIIAATLIAKSPARYGFEQIHYQAPLKYEKVKMPGGADLRWFAQVSDIPFQILKDLNPELNRERTPADQDEYLLKIPLTKKKKAAQAAQVCWTLESTGTAAEEASSPRWKKTGATSRE